MTPSLCSISALRCSLDSQCRALPVNGAPAQAASPGQAVLAGASRAASVRTAARAAAGARASSLEPPIQRHQLKDPAHIGASASTEKTVQVPPQRCQPLNSTLRALGAAEARTAAAWHCPGLAVPFLQQRCHHRSAVSIPRSRRPALIYLHSTDYQGLDRISQRSRNRVSSMSASFPWKVAPLEAQPLHLCSVGSEISWGSAACRAAG